MCPDYPKPAGDWLLNQIGGTQAETAGLRSQRTEFIVDAAGVCRAIIGNLVVDQAGNPTGLTGFGIAVFTAVGWVNVATSSAAVSSLPSSPQEGQIVNFLADSTNGVIWRFRYRAASSSGYKWEFIGGAQMYSEVATDQTTTSETYAGLTTAGPSIEVPLAGDYDVAIGAAIYGAVAGSEGKMSYKIGAAAALDENAISQYLGGAAITTASPVGNTQRLRRRTGLAANTALLAQYRTPSKAEIHFRERWMSVIPVRVG